MSTAAERTTFAWQATVDRLASLAQDHVLRVAGDRRAIEAVTAEGTVAARLVPPLLLSIEDQHASADHYLASLRAAPGRHAMLLLRAGAAALGLWDGDEILRHKVIKKYVVRGHGKAQTTYRKTKGKSRYGSRLRLQNAESLLVDVSQRLCDWREQDAGFDRLLYYCPERQWAEFLRTDPTPPLTGLTLTWLGLSIHEPGFEELLRVRRLAGRGAVEWLQVPT
jgi:hypothetical protein